MKNQLNIYIEAACRQGLSQGVFGGVSARVSVGKEKARYQGCFSGGLTRLDGQGVALGEQTRFDLASLTKPLATTLSILHLIGLGKLEWEQTCLPLLERAIPQEKKGITLSQLLSHCSGLPAYRPYFEKYRPEVQLRGSFELLKQIIAEPLEFLPGSRCQYSDLGFILLGAIVEKISGQSLAEFFRQTIADPLHLGDELCFLPQGQRLPLPRDLIAATEDCPWRHRVLQGEVHDEHCWLMGGVAGHAGLFGTSGGVLRLGERILDCWQDRSSHPAFTNSLLQQLLTSKHPSGSWCLGFDTPSPGSSSSGSFFSPGSVGHLGFTGTSLWIDPQRDIVVVLLTNRVHPSRDNIKIRQFRPFFHDYLMQRIVADL